MAKAFLRAQAALFGSYRDALRYKPVRIESFAKVLQIPHCEGSDGGALEPAADACLSLRSSAVSTTVVSTELIDRIDGGPKNQRSSVSCRLWVIFQARCALTFYFSDYSEILLLCGRL